MIQRESIPLSAPGEATARVPEAAACPVCGAPLPPGVREEFCPVCMLSGSAGAGRADTGRVLGDCELFEEIGRGGMGVVWRGRQRGLLRDVAVKTLPGGDFAGAEARARFHIEAQAAARLNHPNIVSIHEVGEEDGMPYFVMELVPGRTLSAETAERLPAPRTAATWVQQAALGVQHAHEQSVLHRDLKPSNIIIEPDPAGNTGRPRVMDFGLAKLTDTESGLTLSGSAAGSPAYMAPEAVRGGAATALGDVYGLGAVLYSTLTGRPPFGGDSVAAVLAQVEREEPVPPRRLTAGVPRDLETICLKCLEKNPAHRYASAGLLAADLGRFLNGETVLARPVAWPGKLARWAARRPALAAALALAFLALAATAVISTIAAVRIDRERKSAEAAARAATHTTAELHVQEASRRMEQGDFLGALPSLVAALKAEEQDPALARTHAVRLAAAVGECPRLLHVWDFGRQKLQSATGAESIISSNPVLSAAFSPDGRRLACANGWTTSLFNVETGKPEAPPFQRPAGKARPSWVAFSANGGRLLEGTLDGQLTLWDVEKQTPIVSGLPHALGGAGTSSLFPPVLASTGRRLVRAQAGPGTRSGLWVVDVDERNAAGQPAQTQLWPGVSVSALALSRDDRLLAAGSAGGEIQLWDFTTLQPLGSVWKLPSRVRRLDISADGKRLAVLLAPNMAQIHSLADGILLGAPVTHSTDSCYQALFSPDGALMATAAYGPESAHVLEGSTGRLKFTLRTGIGFGSAVFNPEGTQLLTAGWDGTAHLWSTGDGRPLGTVALHGGRNFTAIFSPDGRRVFTGGQDGIGRLWELPPAPPPAGLARALVSANGRWAVTRETPIITITDRILGLRKDEPPPDLTLYPLLGWSIATNKQLGSIPYSMGTVGGVSDNGIALLYAEGIYNVRRLEAPPDVPPLAKFPRVIALGDTAAFEAISADGRRAVVSRDSRKFTLHDITRPDAPPCGTFTLPGKIYRLAWSPDGALAAFASPAAGKTAPLLTVIRLSDGTTAATIPTLPQASSLAFSADSRRLAWGSVGGLNGAACQVHDAATGERLGTITHPHANQITALAFSPDGRLLAMGGRDPIIRLIDTRTWQPDGPPLKATSHITHLSFSHDSHWVVGTGADGRTRVWDATTSQPITPPLLIAAGAETSWLTDDDQTLIAIGSGLFTSMATRHLIPRPAASLITEAELLSGHRHDPVAGLVPIPQKELVDLWEKEAPRLQEGRTGNGRPPATQ